MIAKVFFCKFLPGDGATSRFLYKKHILIFITNINLSWKTVKILYQHYKVTGKLN